MINLDRRVLIILLLVQGMCIFAQDIVPDLNKVAGIENFNGSEQAKALLKKNGFVVLPEFYHRIFSPYVREKNLCKFVTADSVFNTFHVIFEEEIKKLETSLFQDVDKITKTILAHLVATGDKVDARFKAGLPLAIGYLKVVEYLLNEEIPSGVASSPVNAELDKIYSASSVEDSPLMEYKMDYTQFKPRGFYTGSQLLKRYFRAMTWYGRAVLRLNSEKQTMAALLITQALDAAEEASESWDRIDRLYTFLIGPCDDLSPKDYALVLKQAKTNTVDQDILSMFKSGLLKLKDPRINNQALSAEQMEAWQELVKGMCFFGQRYIPDSEVFMNLTHPKVPERGFPTGIDLMAANGSYKARAFIETSPQAKIREYETGLTQSTSLLSRVKSENKSHYACILRLLESLTVPPVKEAAEFAKTTAYADKSLMTALASWASIRHTWQLQAKGSVMCIGISELELVPGYVEPNPVFFSVMQEMIQRTIDNLRDIEGVSIQRFEELAVVVKALAGIVDKELSGRPFTNKEIELLQTYGDIMGELEGFRFNTDGDSQYPWMSLISDVHNEMLTQACLEVGTGGAMPIYVVVPCKGGVQLLIGAVYSYYEFIRPVGQRLTDEEWRSMWEHSAPEMPSWTMSFIAPSYNYDVQDLLDRLSNEEYVPELSNIDDPRIDAFLEKAIQPDGEYFRKKNYWFIIDLSAKRLGHKIVPLLIKAIKNSNYNESDFSSMIRAIAATATEEDVASLRESIVDDYVYKRMFEAPSRISYAWQNMLISVMQKRNDTSLRNTALNALSLLGSKDITPVLLDMWSNGDDAFKAGLMDTIVCILRDVNERGSERLAPRSDPAQLAQWEREVRKLAVKTIAESSGTLRDHAIEASGLLNIEEAVPAIAKLVSVENLSQNAYVNIDKSVTALERIGNRASIEVLKCMLSYKNVSSARYYALPTVTRIDPIAAVPYLIQELKKHDSGSAILSLKEIGHPAVPLLAQALLDKDQNVCSGAAQVLGKIGIPAMPVLISAFKGNDPYVKRCVADALGELFGRYSSLAIRVNIEAGAYDKDVREVIALLTQALGDSNSALRKASAHALGEIGGKASQSIPSLLSLLKDHPAEIRQEAVWALGRIMPKSRASVPFFIGLVNDQDVDIKDRAIEALGNIGPEASEAIPVLIQQLKAYEDHITRIAIDTLGKIGLESLPVLIQILNGKDEDMKYLVVNPLVKIGPDAVHEILMELKRPGTGIKPWAMEFFSCLCYRKITVVINIFKDKDIDDEIKAKVASVIKNSYSNSVQALINTLKDPDPQARYWSVFTLGLMPGYYTERAIPALTAVASDQNEDTKTREAASKALKKIKEKKE